MDIKSLLITVFLLHGPPLFEHTALSVFVWSSVILRGSLAAINVSGARLGHFSLRTDEQSLNEDQVGKYGKNQKDLV